MRPYGKLACLLAAIGVGVVPSVAVAGSSGLLAQSISPNIYRLTVPSTSGTTQSTPSTEKKKSTKKKAKKAKKAKDDDTTTSPKEDILARASKASPNRGRYWAPVRKDFNNWRDSVSETVLKVLAKMESEGEFSS